jgi:hypothetical protein
MNTIIYDTELFDKVYAQNNDTGAWRTFLRVYDYRFPIGTFNFCGIRKTNNQIVLLDAGCNGKFNNYIIRKNRS